MTELSSTIPGPALRPSESKCASVNIPWRQQPQDQRPHGLLSAPARSANVHARAAVVMVAAGGERIFSAVVITVAGRHPPACVDDRPSRDATDPRLRILIARRRWFQFFPPSLVNQWNSLRAFHESLSFPGLLETLLTALACVVSRPSKAGTPSVILSNYIIYNITWKNLFLLHFVHLITIYF